VIDDEGNQLGIMAPFEALKIARERTLDLVEVSPTAQPPVCRIMDYGKYLYEQEKRERAAKKNQHQIVVKEVKFRINVDDHDYDTMAAPLRVLGPIFGRFTGTAYHEPSAVDARRRILAFFGEHLRS